MFSTLLSAVLAVSLGQAQVPPSQPTDRNQASGHHKARNLDGKWEVVYIEMDGKEIKKKDFGDVTVRGNKLTCKHDGKEKSWTLEFGPHQRVRAEQTSGATSGSATSGAAQSGAAKSGTAASGSATNSEQQRHSHGVYIASQEYLCFSMNQGRDTTGGTGRETTSGAGRTPAGGAGRDTTTSNPGSSTGSSAQSGHGAYGSQFVLILRREGNGRDN